MFRKATIIIVYMTILCYEPIALASEPNDYIIPGKSYLLEGTLSGLRQAYQYFDSGLSDPLCPDCTSNRELIFLHAVSRTTMLFVDNNDLSVSDSFLEVAEKLGVTVVGDSFDPCAVYPLDVNVLLDVDGFYRIPIEAPNAEEIGDIVNYSIIPEINDIIAELDSISDSPEDRFRIFFEPNQTGLETYLELDYGEVLILKGLSRTGTMELV